MGSFILWIIAQFFIRYMFVCLIIYSVIILCILLHYPYNFTPSFFVILKILSIPIILSFKKFRNFPQQHLNNIQPLEEDSSPGEQYLKNKVNKIEVRARGIPVFRQEYETRTSCFLIFIPRNLFYFEFQRTTKSL